MSNTLFGWIFSGFILFTVIGTISHELGHILVAKYYGYKTKLSYGSMTYFASDRKIRYNKIHDRFEEEIKSGTEFPGKNDFLLLGSKLKSERFWVTMGGPVQTMLTGTIGLILLIYFRKNRATEDLNLRDWLLVFLTLFWLREPFNLLGASVKRFFFNEKIFYGDEFRIASFLDLPYWSVSIGLGLLGSLIGLYVVFKILPKKYRTGFILAGFSGGLSGFYLWFNIVGPYVFNS